MTLTQLFTQIANAIRSKKGTSNTIVAENFPTEIESIVTTPNLQDKSITINSNTTTTIQADSGYDGLDEVSVTTNVQPNLQSKNVTITENTTTNILPDSGYDGLSGVAVTTNISGGGDTPTINSFDDISTYVTQKLNVVDTILKQKISNYPAYTQNAVTLYAPTADTKYYLIHLRSNGEYRIVWSTAPYVIITTNGDYDFYSLRQQFPSSPTYETQSYNDFSIGMTRLNDTASLLRDKKERYVSNSFTTIAELINNIISGNITYTKIDNNGYMGFAIDTPYVIPYSNTNIYDFRNGSTSLIATQRISQDETLIVKS